MKLIKNIFIVCFFSINKNGKWIFLKTQRKTPKKARERYQNISEEVKNKIRKKAQEMYQNLLKKKKKSVISQLSTEEIII